MELISVTMADRQTVVVNIPFPDDQMPQFTFAIE